MKNNTHEKTKKINMNYQYKIYTSIYW